MTQKRPRPYSPYKAYVRLRAPPEAQQHVSPISFFPDRYQSVIRSRLVVGCVSQVPCFVVVNSCFTSFICFTSSCFTSFLISLIFIHLHSFILYSGIICSFRSRQFVHVSFFSTVSVLVHSSTFHSLVTQVHHVFSPSRQRRHDTIWLIFSFELLILPGLFFDDCYYGGCLFLG